MIKKKDLLFTTNDKGQVYPITIAENVEGIDSYETIDGAKDKYQKKGNYLNFDYEKNNPERKVITLNNTDIFMGKVNKEPLEDKFEVSKNTVTLMQLNKWNVVDLGSPYTMTNINTPDDVRPTIQEKSQSGTQAHKMAYLDDLEEYAKMIDIPTDELPERKAIPLKEGDMILGGGNNLIMLNRWGVVDLGTSESPINLNVPKGVRPTVQEKGQSGSKAHQIAYMSDFEEYQLKGNYLTYEDKDGRKVITLNNNDIIGAIANTEQEGRYEPSQSWNSLIALNKWNVVDLGSPHTKINLNTPKDVRPTVQEKGMSGEKAHEIAYMSDFDSYATKSELNNLKAFIKAFASNSIDLVTTADDKTKTDGNLNVTGNYVGTKARTTYTANSGNINCYDLDITDSSLALVAPNGNISITELKASGDCFSDKPLRCLSADADGELLVKDCIIDEECYNGIQLNMDKAISQNVTIENVKLNGVNNNGIIVFGTKDDAVINIKNIDMTKVKNAFRFSNSTNAQNVVVNIENVNIDSASEKVFLFEDMKKVEGKDTTDLFKNMTFNIKNVKIGGKLITSETDYAEIMQMVVGRPSQYEDIQVELTDGVLPTFKFE